MRACMHANGMHKNYAGTDVMSPDRTILSKIVRTYFACMHALCHGVYTTALPFASLP
jgi:hypothetical protein